eukprot:TRINITY_DN78247_c0_g1_i1.p1 TRINITY_DN78247_c0_g1~~TRINITY_DN78247_c0_g1_i1.p1  ORF type:complete len:511 (+),score=115.40 TRINITY_DN78247_c0_g1_i1:43-1533(+)
MEPASKRLRSTADKSSWLRHLGVQAPGKRLILATDCGGSLGPASALADLGLVFQHSFACESDPSTQRLLAAQPPELRPACLFGSMIGRDRGSYCLVNEQWMPMPQVQPDLYVANAGTHGPNPDRFLAAVKYIIEHRPKVVILEDLVAACREDHAGNLAADAILALLEGAGDYEVDVFQVWASHYGLPQRRQRVYYVMVRKELLHAPCAGNARCERREADPLRVVRQSLEQLSDYVNESPTAEAEDFLMQSGYTCSEVQRSSSSSALGSRACSQSNGEAHSIVGEVSSEASQATGERAVAGLLAMSADVSYLHRRLRRELQLSQDDVAYFAEAGLELSRWLRTYREADLCQIHWLRARSMQREIRFVCTSQDAHRASLSFAGEVPGLAANTRLWSYRLQRLLGGREMLLLQGFQPAGWSLEVLSEAALCRVAGGAMAVHPVAALVASVLAAADLEAPPLVEGQSEERRSVSLTDLRSRYSSIRQRLGSLRKMAKLGA